MARQLRLLRWRILLLLLLVAFLACACIIFSVRVPEVLPLLLFSAVLLLQLAVIVIVGPCISVLILVLLVVLPVVAIDPAVSCISSW